MWQYVSERHIFYAVLAINIILLLSVKFYPSMDGPAHLYNSNVLGQILQGETELSRFFSINSFVLPNWTGHFILAAFNLFLPAWLAEKVLLIFYIAGIAFSFRLLVSALNPEWKGLSILIFPFAYSFLFYLGFYNFSLSFVFLFFTLYFWIKAYSKDGFWAYFKVFIFLALTYYAAILTFFFAGLSMGILTLALSAGNLCANSGHRREAYKKAGKSLFYLFLISLPLLVLAILFVTSVQFFPATDRLTTHELLKWLVDVRCLIVYNYDGDRWVTQFFFYLLLIIAAISVFLRFKRQTGSFFQLSDVLLIPFFLALGLFFMVPTSAGAGMMSDRYCLLVFIFFVLWASSLKIPRNAGRVFVAVIVLLHLGLLLKHHNSGIRGLNKHAVQIYEASSYIHENSIVLPVNMSDNWLEPHFSNYLGVDKPMIILENYEASVGWFPLKWDGDNFPRLQAGGADQINGVGWLTNTEAPIKQIDYIFIYGNLAKLNKNQWEPLKNILKDHYQLTYSTADNYLVVYQLANN